MDIAISSSTGIVVVEHVIVFLERPTLRNDCVECECYEKYPVKLRSRAAADGFDLKNRAARGSVSTEKSGPVIYAVSA